VSSTTKDFPPLEHSGDEPLTEQINEFPLFSPIPWASAVMPNDRYSSPPADATPATTVYPASNGVDDDHDHDIIAESTGPSNPTPMSTAAAPPIDAVDVGIIPESLARAVQAGGPPPRSPTDLNASVEDKAMDEANAMQIE